MSDGAKNSAPSETIRSYLLKIKTLAERGLDGEREVAEAKLRQLLVKHGLTIEDLADVRIAQCEFSVRGELEKRLLIQCAAKLLRLKNVSVWTPKRQRNKVWIELTKEQYADLDAMWTHYRAEFRKTLEEQGDLIVKAFINKYDLCSGIKSESGPETLSEEETIALIMAMQRLKGKQWMKPMAQLSEVAA